MYWVRRPLFWDCFVPRSLREEMGAAMGAAVGGLNSAINRYHLVVSPPGLHSPVWDVAALVAMEHGCQRMQMFNTCVRLSLLLP